MQNRLAAGWAEWAAPPPRSRPDLGNVIAAADLRIEAPIVIMLNMKSAGNYCLVSGLRSRS